MSEKILEESGLIFDFTGSLAAYKFDKKTYAGLLAVDFVVETTNKLIFVEVKNVNKNVDNKSDDEWLKYLKPLKHNPFLFDMGVKFKDTVLKKWACEEVIDKEIHYIVLLEFDKFNSDDRKLMFGNFHTYLPLCLKDNADFKKHINLKSYRVFDVKQWNNHKYFKKFPIEVAQ